MPSPSPPAGTAPNSATQSNAHGQAGNDHDLDHARKVPLKKPEAAAPAITTAQGSQQGLTPAPASSVSPASALPGSMTNGGLASQPTVISADDIALYDRQIRLWGLAAQAKIQEAKVLLITIRALANEIAKNLVLAGIGSITLLDGSPVTEADLGAQFFLHDHQDALGLNRAEAASVAMRKLNPRVNVHVDPESVSLKGPSYFAGFDVVIATDLDPETFNIINTATRINRKAFYAAGTHGIYGFIFNDLIEHEFIIEREASNVTTQPQQETRTRAIINVKTRKDGVKTLESVAKREAYSTWFLASDIATLPEEYTRSRRRLRTISPTLSCLRALWEFQQLKGPGALPADRDDLKTFTQIATQKHRALSLPSETLRPEFLRSFLQNLGSEIAPIAAILGGQVAQDVINVLGQTQQPIQNMVVFDGEKMEAAMYALHPDGPLGASLFSTADETAAFPDVTTPGDLGFGAPSLGAIPLPHDAPLASAAFTPLDIPVAPMPHTSYPLATAAPVPDATAAAGPLDLTPPPSSD